VKQYNIKESEAHPGKLHLMRHGEHQMQSLVSVLVYAFTALKYFSSLQLEYSFLVNNRCDLNLQNHWSEV